MKEYLERAANAAHLDEQSLRVVLDALPVPLSWATLDDGEIRFVNAAFTKAFGHTQSDFRTVTEWIDRFYPRERDRQEAIFRWRKLWQESAEGISEIDAFEVQILCADQTIRTVEHRGIILQEMGIGIAVFHDITDRIIAENTLRRFAQEDPLTGLANRRMLQQHWDRLTAEPPASAQTTVLLLIDLDGFKSVNDRFGHAVGDDILVATAGRLKKTLGGKEVLCRLGGDEFVVLMPDLHDIDRVDHVCRQIFSAISEPMDIQGHAITLGASIGASLYPHDGAQLRELLKRADEALYRRKSGRKGGWEWYRRPNTA
ncbi:diguanylate cyclase (GGDEF)-like protein [Amorphus suaedae]